MSGEDHIEWPEESRMIERTESDMRATSGQQQAKQFSFQDIEQPKGF